MLTKISMFDQNFDLWPKFRSFTKISKFDQNFDFPTFEDNNFSDDWLEKDGGHFESLNSDENGNPISICKSWLPKRNYFNFFRVTNNSYHQVKEVYSRQKIRKSLTGWFHTKDPLPPEFKIVCHKLLVKSDFWAKFRFFKKKIFFFRKFFCQDCWWKLRFLVEKFSSKIKFFLNKSIFILKFGFSSKIRFFFVKNSIFLSKSRFLSKI